jgi:hypothetical protein
MIHSSALIYIGWDLGEVSCEYAALTKENGEIPNNFNIGTFDSGPAGMPITYMCSWFTTMRSGENHVNSTSLTSEEFTNGMTRAFEMVYRHNFPPPKLHVMTATYKL